MSRYKQTSTTYKASRCLYNVKILLFLICMLIKPEYKAMAAVPKEFPLIYQETYLQLLDHWPSANMFYRKNETVIKSVWPLLIEGQKAQSVPHLFFSSPWGNLKSIKKLVPEVLTELNQNGISELEFWQAPLFYPDQEELKVYFESIGLEAQKTEPAHFINIDQQMLEDKIHISEVRRIGKCAEVGIKIERLNQEKMEAAFAHIDRWKEERAHQNTFDFDKIKERVVANPEAFYLYGGYLKNRPVAYGFFMHICNGILHYFLSATDPEWDSHSPITQLLSTAYLKGKLSGFQCIDMGSSMLSGKPNLGLINFKERMGAQRSEKIRWRLKL